jgi:hypothetical protein
MHGGLERFVVWRSINFWPFDTLCKLQIWYFIKFVAARDLKYVINIVHLNCFKSNKVILMTLE